MLKTAIVILITYDKILLSTNYEDIMDCLLNEVLKNGFFNNETRLKFDKAWEDLDIPNELMSNLEHEYSLAMKVQESNETINKLFDFK